MQNWTIGKRIAFGFALLITITALVGTFSCVKLSQLRGNVEDVAENWLPSLLALTDVERSARISVRHLLEKMVVEEAADSKRLDDLLTAEIGHTEEKLKAYAPMVTAASGETPFYEKTTATFAPYKASLLRIQALLASQRNKEAEELYVRETRGLLTDFTEALRAEVDFNRDHSLLAAREADTFAQATFFVIVAGVLLSIVSGVAVALAITAGTKKILARVSGELESGAHQIAAAAGQVSAGSQTLAEAASEQAASLEETSSSIEELGSMTKRNAENALAARDLSGQTRAAAETGAARTAEMAAEMKAIETASEEMRRAMDEIKASSDSVGKIIKTIDEIAFQTNILALNAAVEAARAGAAGSGFAVVAEEVRSLAQRSAEAAKETARLIEQSAAQSQAGVDVNRRVSERITGIAQKSGGVRTSLDEIVEKVRRVDALVGEISDASKEQTAGLDQITIAMGQMDKTTQSNAAGAEEAAGAAEELNNQAEEMRGSVATLLKLVDGARQEETPRAALPRTPARGALGAEADLRKLLPARR